MKSDAKIILSANISDIELEWPGETLCVHHKSYPLPPIARCRYLAFDEFKKSPRERLSGVRRLAVVGLNKIITPANRTEEVFEILFNNTGELVKVSIDHTLFVSEPWRAWFHFGLTGTRYREYSYSYLAQSHYNSFRDGAAAQDPFSIDAIEEWGRGAVLSTYETYFAPLEVEIVETSAQVKLAYARLKEECFEEEHGIARIIMRLARFAQSACPRRSIPTPSACFDRARHRIVASDLKVDAYLVSRLRELCDLTNAVGSRFKR